MNGVTPSRRQNAFSSAAALPAVGGNGGAVERLHRRAREVGRQVETGRRARQLAPPVVELPRQRATAQPLPLPDGEVGVLHRQLRQRRRPPRGEGLVERHQLAQQDLHRPAVGDDVVHRQQQDVPLRAEPQQRGAQERTGGEVERLDGLAPRRRPRPPRLRGRSPAAAADRPARSPGTARRHGSGRSCAAPRAAAPPRRGLAPAPPRREARRAPRPPGCCRPRCRGPADPGTRAAPG